MGMGVGLILFMNYKVGVRMLTIIFSHYLLLCYVHKRMALARLEKVNQSVN